MNLQKIVFAGLILSATTAQASVCDRSPGVQKSLEQSLQKHCSQIDLLDLLSIQDLMVNQPISTSQGTSLKSADFDGLRNTKSLVLNGPPTDGAAYRIEVGTFHGLDSLVDLKFNSHHDIRLTDQSFQGLSSLRTLSFHSSRIYTVITKEILAELPLLERLEFSMGSFRGLRANALDNSPNLKEVIFSYATPKAEDLEQLRLRYPHIEFILNFAR